jgi:two-component system response regulator NreC
VQGEPQDFREAREVHRLLALGHTNQEIAEKLFITVRTVEANRARIMQRLRFSTSAELVHYGLGRGLLETVRLPLPRP